MSKNLEGIVAEIRRVRSQKRPEIEKKKQRLDALLAAVQTTRGKAGSVAAHYPDLAAAMQGISFNEAENKLLEALKGCDAALLRLCRDSINIGVAGLSGQGKSQILRMLTGLGDSQIPTGGGSACTAVQSIVHNDREHEQKAVIHFLSQAELLEKKVYPSFAEKGSSRFALGIGPRPGTLEQFLAMDLDALVPESEQDAARNQADENWDKVKDLQRALKDNAELVHMLGSAPKEIPFGEVREWLVKDKGETKHNVVEYVEMWTSFDAGLPDGLTVLDLPGLGDPTPGIEEDMRNNLKYKTDIVFFLRKAERDGSRELWKTIDHDAFDMIKEIYPNPADGIKPSDWVQLVLNQDTRKEHWNEANTELLKKTVRRGFAPVLCDCGYQDKVRDMVDANIDALVNQAGRIDDLRIREAETAFRAALDEVGSLYNALRNASGDIVAQESGFPFEKRLLSFMANLRGPFKSDSSEEFQNVVAEVFRRHFREVKAEFERIYKESEGKDEFPSELPVFSKKRIGEEFDAGYGPVGVIEKAVRNQREAVLGLLRQKLEDSCTELENEYFRYVRRIGFDSNPSLTRIIDAKSADRECWEQFRSALQQAGTFASLDKALGGLLGFRLTFDGAILPAIYATEELVDFDPEHVVPDDERSNLRDVKQVIDKQHDTEERTKTLFNWLKQQSEMILSSITAEAPHKAFGQLVPLIATTMRANYDSFVFRFIWGDTVDDEWRRFVDRNKAIFWKDEFEKAAENSRLAQDWNAALAELAKAI